MVILYTLYKNAYLDIKELDNLNGVTCYVNCTNRCFLSCTFCLRNTKKMFENNSLWLDKEPSVEMIVEEFNKYDLKKFKEVVFCGFGEPLVRYQDVIEVARYLKQRRPDLPIRINTNGLASKALNQSIVEGFEGVIDVVSISLNAPTNEEYYQITRSPFGIASLDYLLDFTKEAKKYVNEVILTVVDVIGEEKIKECQSIAKELGVRLRVREFES